MSKQMKTKNDLLNLIDFLNEATATSMKFFDDKEMRKAIKTLTNFVNSNAKKSTGISKIIDFLNITWSRTILPQFFLKQRN